MKKLLFTLLLLLCLALTAKTQPPSPLPEWENFAFPTVVFNNRAEGTEGWATYQRVIPDPVAFIRQHALSLAQIIFWSANDEALPDVRLITYNFEDEDGISAKWGEPPNVGIWYSSRWVEQNSSSDSAMLYETRGVLYHELLHVYQAQPRGCGNYGNGPGPNLENEFWIFTEGLADAVRYHAGFFPESRRTLGGKWRDGYGVTGFFLQWLTTKDPDFLRKFHKTAYDFEAWSFDAAMQSIFGPEVTTDSLWREYQLFLISLQ